MFPSDISLFYWSHRFLAPSLKVPIPSSTQRWEEFQLEVPDCFFSDPPAFFSRSRSLSFFFLFWCRQGPQAYFLFSSLSRFGFFIALRIFSPMTSTWFFFPRIRPHLSITPRSIFRTLLPVIFPLSSSPGHACLSMMGLFGATPYYIPVLLSRFLDIHTVKLFLVRSHEMLLSSFPNHVPAMPG